jgi:hypothetical protein
MFLQHIYMDSTMAGTVNVPTTYIHGQYHGRDSECSYNIYTIAFLCFLCNCVAVGVNLVCVTRLTRHVSLVEQELLTIPEHPSSLPVFSGVCVTRS